jgi:hypothetical protein
MKAINLLFFIFLLQACDTPQRTRNPYGLELPVSSSETPGEDSKVSDVDSDGAGDDKSDDSTDGGVSDTPTTTTGFEDCNLSFQFFGNAMGYFGLCQNSEMETKFKLKMAMSDTSVGTCFVPIHIQNTGSSFKLGIAECVHNEANKEYEMTLTKDRGENVNGVMVIKSNALNAYMQCMSAKVDFINAYAPNCAYDSNCLQAADNYAANVCSQFVSTYKNYYKQVPL